MLAIFWVLLVLYRRETYQERRQVALIGGLFGVVLLQAAAVARFAPQHPEIIVLSNILADPVNAYLSDFRFQIVDEINGQKIKHLSDVAHAFAASADQYVIKFLGSNRPAVLEKRAVEAAQQRIKRNYNVSIEQNLGQERL